MSVDLIFHKLITFQLAVLVFMAEDDYPFLVKRQMEVLKEVDVYQYGHIVS